MSNLDNRKREVSPGYILVMLLGLNVILGIGVSLFPEGERTLAGLDLQFVSPTELFNKKEHVVVDLDTIIGDIQVEDTAMASGHMTIDTSYNEPEDYRRITYPTDLVHPLDNFFRALKALEKDSTKKLRVVHYGDSQLEGDRISDYLRHKLQNRFGGLGPGIVLPIDVSNARRSIRQSESPDWKKYAIYTQNRLDNGFYGIGGSSYEYTGKYSVKIGEDTIVTKLYDSMVTKIIIKQPIPDKKSAKAINSTASDTIRMLVPYDSTKFVWDTVFEPIYERHTTTSSWLKYRCATSSYPRVRKFNQVDLLYQSNDTSQIKYTIDGITRSKMLMPKPVGGKVTLFSDTVNSQVYMEFTGPSPLIFGTVLEGQEGISVDNFPMRGSSGTGYTLMNPKVYAQQLKANHVGLIIMQFGINVVPNPQKRYGYYKRMFANQIQAIKRAAPDVDILVIGPSDMSRKVGTEFESYPNITLIAQAMMEAAYENNCAFWNLYQAMGGKNSMVGWVQNDPPLAAQDYTHFNYSGAKYIGEMLYNALMGAYSDWKKTP